MYFLFHQMEAARCKKCRNVIITVNNLSIYEYNGTHLIINPDHAELDNLFKKEPVKSAKLNVFAHTNLQCFSCMGKIGKIGSIGPNGEDLFSLSVKDLIFEICGESKRLFKNAKDLKSNVSEGIRSLDCKSFSEIYSGLKTDDKVKKEEKVALETKILADLSQLDFQDHQNLLQEHFIPRSYQVEAYSRAITGNSIVVLPTGAGKTLVAAMVIAKMATLNPGKKILFLVDRVNLVTQQQKFLKHALVNISIGEISGQNSSRKYMFKVVENQVIVMTAAILKNMLIQEAICVDDLSLVVFDEAHHGRSNNNNHIYNELMTNHLIAEAAVKPLILGLTASPAGADDVSQTSAALNELSKIFGAKIVTPILTRGILSDVIRLPNLHKLIFDYSKEEALFNETIHNYLSLHIPFLESNFPILKEQDFLQVTSNNFTTGSWRGILKKAYHSYEADQENDLKTTLFHLMKIWDCFDVNQIYGPRQTCKELETYLQSKESCVGESTIKLKQLVDNILSSVEHNEIKWSTRTDLLCSTLEGCLAQMGWARGIIFVEKRIFAKNLLSILKDNFADLNPEVYVGNNTNEVTFAKQKMIIDDFNSGYCRLLIATSVLEEGLDITECNFVVRYNSTYSLTAFIQSRGRARMAQSKFFIMGTRKEIKTFESIEEQERVMVNCVYQEVQRKTTQEESLLIQDYLRDYECIVLPLLQDSKKEEKKVISDKFLLLEFSSHNRGADSLAQLQNNLKPILGDENVSLDKNSKTLDARLNLQGPAYDDESNKKNPFQVLADFIFSEETIKVIEGYHLRVASVLLNHVPADISWQGKDLSYGYLASKDILFQRTKSLFGIFSVGFESEEYGFRFYNEQNFEVKERVLIDPSKLFEKQVYISYPNRDGMIHMVLPLSVAPKFEREEYVMDQKESGRVVNVQHPQNLALVPFFLACTFTINDANDMRILISHLHTRYIDVRFSRITMENDTTNQVEALRVFIQDRNLAENETLEVVSFLTRNPCIAASTFAKAFQSIDCDKISVILANCYKEPSAYIWNDEFGKEVNAVSEIIVPQKLRKLEPKVNYEFIRRLIFTPSRFVLMEPMCIQTNRVIRHFGSKDFLIVQFLGEDLDRLDTGQVKLLENVKKVMNDGIDLFVGNFKFVGSSNSQFREFHAWFTSRSISEIHDWIGDFYGGTRCRGKAIKRLGLAFSSSTPSITLSEHELLPDAIIPDIISNNCNFSDGIGRISREAAGEIFEILGIEKNGKKDSIKPSAFQIRIAGIKGVLSVCPPQLMCQHEKTYRFLFRDSMIKFRTSNHLQLEILNYARPLPATLNGQIINLLSSLGIQDQVFMDLLMLDLERIRVEVSDPKLCLKLLSEIPLLADIVSLMTDRHVSPLQERFFQAILQSMHDERISAFRRKFRITVPDGMNLMGVLDESGLIPENHIYIEVIDPNTKQRIDIKSATAVVVRNPCLHPGDIRKVSLFRPAKRNEFLAGMVNCVVFSQKGAISIPSVCAGGDLDGDCYTVIWDPRLIPKNMHEPLIYDSQGDSKLSRDLVFKDLIDFNIQYMNQDILGSLANAHVVASDKEGACAPGPLRLAELNAIAVDYPKTEKNISLPGNLKPDSFPEFMEKFGRASYESTKIHGRIYRFCRDITWTGKANFSSNGLFLVEGFENFVGEADRIYSLYCSEVNRLLLKYGLTSEIEVFSGNLANISANLKSGREKEKDYLRQEMQVIWDSFRKYLMAMPSYPFDPRFLYALYYVSSSAVSGNPNFTSFPWILGHDLIEKCLKPGANNQTQTRDYILGQCLYEQWQSDREERISCLKSRTAIANDINAILSDHFPKYKAVLFGSSGNFLFHPFKSDIDICIVPCNNGPDEGDTERLLDKVHEIISSLAPNGRISNVEYKKHFKPPIIRYNFSTSKGINSHVYSVDISCSPESLKKLVLLVPIIKAKPFLLPILYYLNRELRKTGQLMHNITSFGLTWLIIYLLDSDFDLVNDKSIFHDISGQDFSSYEKLARQQCPIICNESSSKLVKFWEKVAFQNISTNDYARIGRAMVTVLEKLSETCKHLSLPDPVYSDREACLTLTPDIGEKLSVLAHKWLHVICKYIYSTESGLFDLLTSVGQSDLIIYMNNHVSKVYLSNVEYQESKLWNHLSINRMEGNKPEISYTPNANGLYIQIKPKDCHEGLLQGCKAYFDTFIERVSGIRLMAKRRAHFAENSLLLLFPFDGSGSDRDHIKFMNYHGPKHSEHEYHLLYPVIERQVSFDGDGSDADGNFCCDYNYARFKDRYEKQILYFSLRRKENPELFQTSKLQVVARFGRNYLFHLPFEQQISIKTPTIKDLEDSIMLNGIYQPWNNNGNNENENDDPRGEGEQDVSDDKVNQPNENFSESMSELGLEQKSRGNVNGKYLTKAISSRENQTSCQSFFTTILAPIKIEEIIESFNNFKVTFNENVNLSNNVTNLEKEIVTSFIDIMTTDRDYKIRLDYHSGKIVSIRKRSVRWLSAVFHGNNSASTLGKDDKKQHDMRIYLETSDSVPLDDEIWKNLLPNDTQIIKLERSPNNNDEIAGIKLHPYLNGKVYKVRIIDRKVINFTGKYGENTFIPMRIHDSQALVFSCQPGASFTGIQADSSRHREIEILVPVDDQSILTSPGFISYFYKFSNEIWNRLMTKAAASK